MGRQANSIKKFIDNHWKTDIKNIVLLTFASIFLALADAFFIVPCGIVSGGVSSIGLIINSFFPDIEMVDIVVAVAQVLLWVMGFIVLGKKFAIHTLYVSIVYPIIFTILYRTNAGEFVYSQLLDPSVGLVGKLLAAIFGGSMIGAGVALAFRGNGSTGGMDIPTLILAKFTGLKESTCSFIGDGSLILIGAIVMFGPGSVPNSLIGIFGALMVSIVIQFAYVLSNSYMEAEIISDKTDEIARYIMDVLDHGCTIYEATGAYTKTTRKVLKVTFNKRELGSLKEFISSVDDRAFVTFSSVQTVNGEGFIPFTVHHKKLKGKKHGGE